MTDVGVVSAVGVERARSWLTAAAGVGATVLTVDDLADFSEAGGHLVLANVVYPYSAGNDEAGTLTLTTPSTLAAAADDPVYACSIDGTVISEKVADVLVGDADEPIEVTVPYALWDRLPEGTRGGRGETVLIEPDGSGYRVADVLGGSPGVEAEFLTGVVSPDNLPPTTPPPDVAPTAAPTPVVTPGIRALHITWPPAAGAREYDVYVSQAAQGIPAELLNPATRLAATVVGTSLTVVNDPASVPVTRLSASTDYRVQIRTRFGSQVGPWGTASGLVRPKLADQLEISADYAYVGAVFAGQIMSDTMTANVTISGAVRTASSGARSVMDSVGFHSFDSSNVERFRAVGGDVKVTGQINATSGTITGNLDLTAGGALRVGDPTGRRLSLAPDFGGFGVMRMILADNQIAGTISTQRAANVKAGQRSMEWTVLADGNVNGVKNQARATLSSAYVVSGAPNVGSEVQIDADLIDINGRVVLPGATDGANPLVMGALGGDRLTIGKNNIFRDSTGSGSSSGLLTINAGTIDMPCSQITLAGQVIIRPGPELGHSQIMSTNTNASGTVVLSLARVSCRNRTDSTLVPIGASAVETSSDARLKFNPRRPAGDPVAELLGAVAQEYEMADGITRRGLMAQDLPAVLKNQDDDGMWLTDLGGIAATQWEATRLVIGEHRKLAARVAVLEGTP